MFCAIYTCRNHGAVPCHKSDNTKNLTLKRLGSLSDKKNPGIERKL
jgi:hypothetical protein